MTGMYLEHYGVKGMKWGKKKSVDQSNSKSLQNTTVRSTSKGLQNNSGRNTYSGVTQGVRNSQFFNEVNDLSSKLAQNYEAQVAFQKKVAEAKKEVDRIVAETNKKVTELNVKYAAKTAIAKLFKKTAKTTIKQKKKK